MEPKCKLNAVHFLLVGSGAIVAAAVASEGERERERGRGGGVTPERGGNTARIVGAKNPTTVGAGKAKTRNYNLLGSGTIQSKKKTKKTADRAKVGKGRED